jgi:hypothetical protein
VAAISTRCTPRSSATACRSPPAGSRTARGARRRTPPRCPLRGRVVSLRRARARRRAKRASVADRLPRHRRSVAGRLRPGAPERPPGPCSRCRPTSTGTPSMHTRIATGLQAPGRDAPYRPVIGGGVWSRIPRKTASLRYTPVWAVMGAGGFVITRFPVRSRGRALRAASPAAGRLRGRRSRRRRGCAWRPRPVPPWPPRSARRRR